MKNTKNALLILPVFLLGVLVLSGCVSRPQGPVNIIKSEPEKAREEAETEAPAKKKAGKVVWVQRPIEEESIISAAAQKGPDYLMNFDNISTPDFIDAMMTGVFKKNYLITDRVMGMGTRFTIKMTEDLKPLRAFQLFKSILSMYNVLVTKKENTYVFDLVKESAALTLKGPMIYGRKVPEGFPINHDEEVTFVVPFHNILPEVVKDIIQAQMPAQSMVFPVKELNLLVINGNYEDIKHTLSFIDLLDRAQFKDKSIVIIEPEYWDIDEFRDKVIELLEAEGIFLPAVDVTKGIMFIPIEKLNSLIVISPVKEWVERVLYWLEKLDIPEAAGEAKKVFTYRLKNVDVEAAAEVLWSYQYGSGAQIPTTGGGTTGITGRSIKKTPSRNVRDEGPTRQTTGRTTRLTPGQRFRQTLKQAVAEEGFQEEVSIIPVLETNSIVLVATPVEYKKYLDIIKRIDVPRNQVFVEVIIGEVSLDQGTQLGLEFWINRYLYRTSFGTKGGLGVYKGTDEEGNVLLPSGSNFFLNGTLPGTQFEILLNALVENSKINIISTPKITVLENEEAEISVGADVPVIASESAIYGGGGEGEGGSLYPFRSVQYISTGIILKVKPAILTDDKISLEIEQEISEALENIKSGISSPEISKRTIKTTMIVKEGEIAFIGGMFQKKLTTIASGIPVISKIPLLGALFRNTKKQVKKTELVVFINSKTIRKHNDMKDIVDGIKKMYSDEIYMENK
ncbi:MAG: secretin N-terminal domain-containing protein [Candidatus Aminicenantes bacterium]|jgi:general secretion pathway protein D